MSDIIRPDWPAPQNIVAGTAVRGSDAPEGAVYLNQVHGAHVVSIADVRGASGPVDADAVIGVNAGDLCCVRTADCLPLLLCDTAGRRIAAVHGGWRGVLAGVIENAVAALGTDPSGMLAWLGPAISQPAFEVGEEVRDAYVADDPASGDCFEPNSRGRWQADLYGLARLRLAKAGVDAVHGGGLCTYSDPRRFYSYRRDPDCGRMVSFIQLL